MKTSTKLLPSLDFGSHSSNAGRQARLKAGAERTLEGVACTRLFGLELLGVPLFYLIVSTKTVQSAPLLASGFLLLEKKPHFFQKPAECWLMLENQVVLALQRHEPRSRNAGSHAAPGVERHARVIAGMQNQRRRL